MRFRRFGGESGTVFLFPGGSVGGYPMKAQKSARNSHFPVCRSKGKNRRAKCRNLVDLMVGWSARGEFCQNLLNVTDSNAFSFRRFSLNEYLSIPVVVVVCLLVCVAFVSNAVRRPAGLECVGVT